MKPMEGTFILRILTTTICNISNNIKHKDLLSGMQTITWKNLIKPFVNIAWIRWHLVICKNLTLKIDNGFHFLFQS